MAALLAGTLLVPLATTPTPRCAGSCLFISEYVEAGSGSANSFIEIYNGCLRPTSLGLAQRP